MTDHDLADDQRTHRPRPLITIAAGAVALVLAAGFGIAIASGLVTLPELIAGSPGDPAFRASALASATAAPTPSPTTIAEPSPARSSSSPSPSSIASAPIAQAPPSIGPDTIIAPIVERLTIRAAPDLDGEALGTLATYSWSYVIAGPEEADGHSWFYVSGLGVPPNSGCITPIDTDPYDCPIWIGWVAAASRDGVPFLEPRTPDCPPERPMIDDLMLEMPPIQRLACFGDRAMTFRAWWPLIGDDYNTPCPKTAQVAWLACATTASFLGPPLTYVSPSEDEDHRRLGIGVDPGGVVAMPPRGNWVEITARHDHPDAEQCRHAGPADPDTTADQARAILDCRSVPVVEAVTVVDGP